MRKLKDGLQISDRSDLTRTDIGVIYDLKYYRTYIGRIGSLSEPYPGNPKFYATPLQGNPFDTTNGVRTFHSRKEAIAWLIGVHDADLPWLRFARKEAAREAYERAEKSRRERS